MVGRPRGCRKGLYRVPWVNVVKCLKTHGGTCSENDLPLLVGFHIEVGLQVSTLGENDFLLIKSGDLLLQDWPNSWVLVDHQFPKTTKLGNMMTDGGISPTIFVGIHWNIHWVVMVCIITNMGMVGCVRSWE